MAQTIPVPRSFNQIVGDMLDAFLSRYGLRNIKAGSPILSIFESAAQSDLRNSQDIFEILNSISLDRAEGQALDRIGLDEDTPRFVETPASGYVTIGDESFTKISSKVFQGKPAPIVGTTSLYVADASSFTSTGSIYIGRGTSNYEGPIAYSAKINNGTYWTLTLSSATQKFHNLGETVILAQGGNRLINSGTIVQTPQGNVSDSIQFSTLYSATIPDGETEITNVLAVAQKSGVVGNVPSGAINSFVTKPFSGATVTNPLPYSNGLPREEDSTYRERIKAVRRSRTKGTTLALKTYSVNVTATDENKRVTSASVVARAGEPTVLYIDDGTGYEEQSIGVAIESLTDLAFGGERYFETSLRPVVKAFVTSSQNGPFTLGDSYRLAVKVGGVLSEHVFSSDNFQSISNASVYEVVASINGDPDLLFSARTADSGRKVALFGKADVNEDIQVVTPSSGTDANTYLGFSTGLVDTMRLYKNDRLLYKDGRIASVESKTSGSWSTLSGSQTLLIAVDGTPTQTITVTDQSFIDAATGYTTVGQNSPEAWAAVFNNLIAGITATVVSGKIVLTSNRGSTSKSKIQIVSGSLVTSKMFDAQTVTGANKDYTLDRNTGQLTLTSSLTANDRLSCGTTYTRAFLESSLISTVTLASNGNLWFSVDGAAQIIATGVTSATALNFTSTGTAWGQRIRCTSATATALFTNVQPGDWVIFWDTAFTGNIGPYAWRICTVDSGFTWFEFERSTAYTSAGVVLTQTGLTVVRSTKPLLKVTFPSGANYTASTIVSTLDGLLKGCDSSVYRTNYVRVSTNTFNDIANATKQIVAGDIALVAADTEGQKLKISTSSAVANLTGHLASVEALNPEMGTPGFLRGSISLATAATVPQVSYPTTVDTDRILVGLRNQDDTTASTGKRFGSNYGHRSAIVGVSGAVVTLRDGVETSWVLDDRFYLASPYMLTFEDLLTVLVDGDAVSKRYIIPMWRKLKPNSTTYAAQNTYKDADNANAAIGTAFGTSFDFKDFALYMSARIKTHNSGDASHYAVSGVGGLPNPPYSGFAVPADYTKTILWRYYRLGPDGNKAQLRYVYPTAPDAAVAISWNDTNADKNQISISLAGGAARTGYTVRATTKVGVACVSNVNDMPDVYYIVNLPIASISRAGGTTVTLDVTLPTGVTDHGWVTGNSVYVRTGDADFPSGVFTITKIDGNTIQYTQAGLNVVAGNIGTVSFDTGGEATLSGGGVIVDDFFRIESGASINASYENKTLRVADTGDGYVRGKLHEGTGVATSATITWGSLVDTANLKIFANPKQTASTIVTAVNALIAANANIPIKPTLIGDGSGTIFKSSQEEGNDNATWFSLVDGINYVQSQVVAGSDYDFVFKNAIDSTLATNSDWINEEVRVVPRTTKNVVNWLNSPTISGLFSTCSIAASSYATKPQISSLTAGSSGSVQVQGGTANSFTAAVVGESYVGSGSVANIRISKTDSVGLHGNMWVAIDNTFNLAKIGTFDTNSTLSSIATDGTFLFDSGFTPVYTSVITNKNAKPQIARYGKFMAYTDTPLGTLSTVGVVEGDWVVINTPAAPTGGETQIDSVNTGIFRVVRVDSAGATNSTFWIENDNGVDQGYGEADIRFVRFNSVMPGDKIQISTSLWHANNKGTWTVSTVGSRVSTATVGNLSRAAGTVSVTTTAAHGLAVGDAFVLSPGEANFPAGTKIVATTPTATTLTYTEAGGAVVSTVTHTLTGREFQNAYVFKVNTDSKTPTAISTPGALGAQSPLVQCIEAKPGRFIKLVDSISPHPTTSTQHVVKVLNNNNYQYISSAAGSIISALDKLAFPTSIITGVDGYRAATGLIAEVNKVIYGDPGDTSTYPGVAAAGAIINISGPLVKRVQVALSIRVKSGVKIEDVEDRIKSAVASVINKTGIGETIALSAIITAASKVTGVVAVTITSPTYTATNDIIPVQPNEKPQVLDLDADIQVSFVGNQ